LFVPDLKKEQKKEGKRKEKIFKELVGGISREKLFLVSHAMWTSTSRLLPYLYGLVFVVGGLAASDTDTDFTSVRSKFVKDYSGTGPSEPPTEKYFRKYYLHSGKF
jgi:hypothetical protein